MGFGYGLWLLIGTYWLATDFVHWLAILNISSTLLISVAVLQADFDKTKHLSDKSIKKRRIERDKLKALEKEREDRVRREREEEEERRHEER